MHHRLIVLFLKCCDQLVEILVGGFFLLGDHGHIIRGIFADKVTHDDTDTAKAGGICIKEVGVGCFMDDIDDLGSQVIAGILDLQRGFIVGRENCAVCLGGQGYLK